VSTFDADLIAVLVEGEAQGRALIESLAGGGDTARRWTSALHLFDYNLDRLGPASAPRGRPRPEEGPRWRPAAWGNHGYEADYELVHHDEHGDTLNGAHRYEVTFDPPPPAKAFWSLTMYDTPNYYLVDNPIDRYSIGDRTPGRRSADDGSSILLQADATATGLRTGCPCGATSARCCRCTNRATRLDGTTVPPVCRADDPQRPVADLPRSTADGRRRSLGAPHSGLGRLGHARSFSTRMRRFGQPAPEPPPTADGPDRSMTRSARGPMGKLIYAINVVGRLPRHDRSFDWSGSTRACIFYND
jgi:hypothetical protein